MKFSDEINENDEKLDCEAEPLFDTITEASMDNIKEETEKGALDQNGSIKDTSLNKIMEPVVHSNTLRRRNSQQSFKILVKKNSKNNLLKKKKSQNSFKSKTKQATRRYTDSSDKIISNAEEMQQMRDFIAKKISKIANGSKKASEVDRVFKQALTDFQINFETKFGMNNNGSEVNIIYSDLISIFETVMSNCDFKDTFPRSMGVNAFRGFLNEFLCSIEKTRAKIRKNNDQNCNGHTFKLTIMNIPTVCHNSCQTYLLWPLERGFVCQHCFYTSHKKCLMQSRPCKKSAKSGEMIATRMIELIVWIEKLGLNEEGIYRKSGVSSKVKELKAKIIDTLSEEVDYDEYNVHVLTNCLKSFLREMPEPLLTFERYDKFLQASEILDVVDREETMKQLVSELPAIQQLLLEQIIFHLAKVALREQQNLMSANSLAIVFAPNILRTNQYVLVEESLKDIHRQTKCIEIMIEDKMMLIESTLADATLLDSLSNEDMELAAVDAQAQSVCTSTMASSNADLIHMELDGKHDLNNDSDSQSSTLSETSSLESVANENAELHILDNQADVPCDQTDSLKPIEQNIDNHATNPQESLHQYACSLEEKSGSL